MTCSLELRFADQDGVTLCESSFLRDGWTMPLRTTRGKTSGAFLGFGTFQWTSAVKALCALVVQARIAPYENTDASLSGFRGDLACSLDESINKETGWILDMFGTDRSGRAYLKSLVLRSNSGLKMPGPIKIVLKPNLLSAEKITLFLNGKKVESRDLLFRLRDLLLLSETRKNSVLGQTTLMNVA